MRKAEDVKSKLAVRLILLMELIYYDRYIRWAFYVDKMSAMLYVYCHGKNGSRCSCGGCCCCCCYHRRSRHQGCTVCLNKHTISPKLISIDVKQAILMPFQLLLSLLIWSDLSEPEAMVRACVHANEIEMNRHWFGVIRVWHHSLKRRHFIGCHRTTTAVAAAATLVGNRWTADKTEIMRSLIVCTTKVSRFILHHRTFPFLLNFNWIIIINFMALSTMFAK